MVPHKRESPSKRIMVDPITRHPMFVRHSRFAASLALATVVAAPLVARATAAPGAQSTTKVFANAGGEPNVAVSPVSVVPLSYRKRTDGARCANPTAPNT